MKNPNLTFIKSRYPGYERTIQGEIMLLTHSLEAPDKAGMARSLANGWFKNPDNRTSVHNISDSVESVQTFEYPYQVWGCGTGNLYVYQFEMVGYAAWSKSQWTTKTMKQALINNAKAQAWVWYQKGMKEKGYKNYPEWLTLTQIKAGKPGLLTHNDARLVWGGTTHTDPGPNFPYDFLRDEIHKELDRLTGSTKPKPKPAPKPTKKKTTAQIVDEVIAGKWGNGDTRTKKLTAAGYNAKSIQAKVNEKLLGKSASKPKPKPKPKPAKKTNATIVNEVIAGKWGNGEYRTKKLREAGYNPATIQAAVNKKLGIRTSSKKNVTSDIVRQVIAGNWGNGDNRKKRLEAAGYDYNAVQAAVNKALS